MTGLSQIIFKFAYNILINEQCNMERYINQLIEDLEQVAQNPPSPTYIEAPSHLDDEPILSELALVPFQTIEELTGIKQEVFPQMDQLLGSQWDRVNEAIFKVFESLHIELVDIPAEIPREWLYEVLTTNWHHPVQYLPSSGMDLELCTQDPMTCPYGDYCSCGEKWEEDEDDIPEHFKNLVPKIAQLINDGFICYLNPITIEMEKIPKALSDDPDKYKMITGIGLEDEDFKHESWDECFTFEPLESHESFKIMEAFSESVEDKEFGEQLFRMLSKSKPFAGFKNMIDQSEYRQAWFDFKQQWLEQYVTKQIFNNINAITLFTEEELNDLLNVRFAERDPGSVPVPGLCVICEKYHSDDQEQNLLCMMTRNDQRDSDDFKCGMFEKI